MDATPFNPSDRAPLLGTQGRCRVIAAHGCTSNRVTSTTFGKSPPVTNQKPLQYTSTHTFLQTCRGHHGAKIAQGWSANQTINIVGSSVSGGRIGKFKATITTTYTPTPLGAGGGCNAAKEVLSGAGTAI
jgi:hypothetical protein